MSHALMQEVGFTRITRCILLDQTEASPSAVCWNNVKHMHPNMVKPSKTKPMNRYADEDKHMSP